MTEQERLSQLQQQVGELARDEAFITRLLDLEEPDQVQAAFAEKGIELSINEVRALGMVLEHMIERDGELSEQDLEEVAGGFFAIPIISTACTIANILMVGGTITQTLISNWGRVESAWHRVKNWFRRW